MLKTVAVAFALSLACAIGSASAQNFPTKPVRFVVPFAPGGSTDTLGNCLTIWRESTPRPVIARLHADIVKSLQQPEVRQRHFERIPSRK